ncbi:MAG: hypothetical protein HC859_15660 [Bacteroidia bacterium]|nr:hypothetical protein [Bacteroidia bacterium]
MFPLNLLPLPGELVPLHIFEPRYQELLRDAEASDISFGIYLSNDINEAQVGSLMKLESVIKRYPGGESDIIAKCIGAFTLHNLHKMFKGKLYPGGEVTHWNIEMDQFPRQALYELFLQYQSLRNIHQTFTQFTIHQIANELSFDLNDRYKYLLLEPGRVERFLMNRLKFQIHVLEQETKSKDVFHLN